MKKLPILLLLLLPVTSPAQFSFTTNSGAITITKYNGTGPSATIPGSTNGFPVNSIGAYAFNGIATLTSVSVPSSVTHYSMNAFDNCSRLSGVYFQGNSPTDSFPAAAPVFAGCANATLYYLQGTTGWSTTFDGLPTVKWDPLVLNQLGFSTNASQVTVTGYSGPGGAIVIPSTVGGFPIIAVESNAFLNLSSLTGVTLPNTVTNLGNSAFAGAGLTSMTIPLGTAGTGVFSGCIVLTNIVFPASLTRIAEAEFSGCKTLSRVTIPAGVTLLSDRAFQNCSNLSRVYFLGNAPSANSTVFENDSSATVYYLPKTSGWGPTFAGRPTVPVLFSYTTNGGTITITKYLGIDGTVVIPDTIDGFPVTTIVNGAFYQATSPVDLTIGRNLTNIVAQALVSGCASLTSITMDPLNPVYRSANGVLFNENLTTLIQYPEGRSGSYAVPDSVASIATYAFQGCSGLTSIVIPASVLSIGGLAFNGCGSLTSVYFLGDIPTTDWTLFYDDSGVTVYYLPGTTGWGTDLQGAVTVLWNPQAQTGDGNFGVRTNRFGFNITGSSNLVVVVEACANLAGYAWSPVSTNTLTGGSSYFSDPDWTNHPGRFYRLRSP